jgi:hypothetical protein
MKYEEKIKKQARYFRCPDQLWSQITETADLLALDNSALLRLCAAIGLKVIKEQLLGDPDFSINPEDLKEALIELRKDLETRHWGGRRGKTAYQKEVEE